MKVLITIASAIILCLVLVSAACDSANVNDSGSFDSAKKGIIEIRVTDAPPEYDIASIDVVFSSVEVHRTGDGQQEGGWIQVTIQNGQIDLLKLEHEDLQELLATSLVEPGTYNQLRVIIDEISVTLNGEGEPPYVFVPSGELKFNQHFVVMDDVTTVLLLDFDAKESMTTTGSGRIVFNPVVHLSVDQE
jgi:hypothetical protein